MEKVLNSLQIQTPQVYYWTDSTIVLHWIKAVNKKWSIFVANRISEIHQLSSMEQWYHVGTNFNPADHVSRRLLPSSLIESKLWWHGPSWLVEDSRNWNMNIPAVLSPEVPEQIICKPVMVVTTNNYDLFDRFSSFTKLIRTIAWSLRFVHNSRNKIEDRRTGRLTAQELNDANLCIVKIIQKDFFKEELHSLRTKKIVSSTSKIQGLAPFIDPQGIIRVGGRLCNSSIPFNRKHPILLPANVFFTKLIIAYEHHKQLHAGVQGTLAAIRNKYWPLTARNSIKKYIRSCMICFKIAPRTSEVTMGNLPEYRVTPSKPFNRSGVDYCGPIYIKSAQRRNAKTIKAYIAIFVCLCTKAVHIELVSDMTTEAFINALERFIARRGKIYHIFSDNGTNFQGATKQLKELYQLLRNKDHQDKIDNMLKEDYIEWHFIPPHAPHFGGIWEAAVKSAKYHLKRITGNAALNFEEMYTVLTQIEAVLNSRPITPISNDPNDFNYLTPGHFLTGDTLTAIPQHDVTHIQINRLTRWQRVNQIYQQFWRRWSKDYLQTLQQRSKWRCSKGTQLKEGDMVLVQNEGSLPLTWTIGRVKEVHSGTNEKPRVATIKTARGIYKRPITKLRIMPLENND